VLQIRGVKGVRQSTVADSILPQTLYNEGVAAASAFPMAVIIKKYSWLKMLVYANKY
jgi:hypothetical protein